MKFALFAVTIAAVSAGRPQLSVSESFSACDAVLEERGLKEAILTPTHLDTLFDKYFHMYWRVVRR